MSSGAFADGDVAATGRAEESGQPGEAPRPAVALPSRSLLEAVLDSSHDGIMAFRPIRDGGVIVDFEWTLVNWAAEAIVGRSAEELLGKRLLVEMPGNAENGLFESYVEVVERGVGFSSEHHYQHEGLDHWFSTIAVRIEDGFAVTFRDVSEQKRLQRELTHRALHDELTQLPNRAFVNDRISEALGGLAASDANDAPSARCLGVLFVDIDRFKVINDSLGHGVGDALLIEVGHRLTTVASPFGSVARFGGDEFLVICDAFIDPEATVALADELRAAIAEPIVIGDRRFELTASIGAVVTSDPEATADSLIRDADAAMYRAKSRGGDRTELFDDELRRHATARLNLETELRGAIDHDQIIAYFQPIIDVATGRVVGSEALVRWVHPERGVIPPFEFLGVAEETGLIVEIGELVLDRALEAMASWSERLDLDAPDFVSVNLSAAQLTLSDLPARVLAALDRSGVDPARLCLEVTETSLINDPAAAEAILSELSALGIKIALDDFGTGYSSLSYLQRFPVDTVKIDRAFVMDLAASSDDRVVVEAVVALAHGLGKLVVAEGVEDARLLDLLVQLQADQAQGFHFSRPIPPHEFAALVRVGSTEHD